MDPVTLLAVLIRADSSVRISIDLNPQPRNPQPLNLNQALNPKPGPFKRGLREPARAPSLWLCEAVLCDGKISWKAPGLRTLTPYCSRGFWGFGFLIDSILLLDTDKTASLCCAGLGASECFYVKSSGVVRFSGLSRIGQPGVSRRDHNSFSRLPVRCMF